MDFLKDKVSEIFNKSNWEVKTVGEIITEDIVQGLQDISNNYKSDGDYPAITCESMLSSGLQINKCQVFVNETLFSKKILIEKGDLLVIVRGFPLEQLGSSSAYLGDENCIAGNNINVIKHSQNSRYLAHLFSSQYVKKQIKLLYTGTYNRPYLNKEDIKKIKLLLPDLETQNRIADFLDKFVHLKSELAFEKEKRMKQFEHYRNSIFGRNEEEILWEIRSLEEIATEIYNGVEITRGQLGTGNYPAIKAGDISSKLSICFEKCVSFVDADLIKRQKYFEHGDLLISNLSNKSETVGKAASYLGNEKCLAGLGVTVVKHNQNPKYLAYALSSNFCRNQVINNAMKGTVVNFWKEKIEQLKIPLPDLETQNQIANSLSRFIDLSSEIDCELKLTNKQYKYYKNAIFS